jgi:hypothetical protein
MKGVTGLTKLTRSSAGPRISAAPSTSGLWKAPLTRSFTVFRAPRAVASSINLIDRGVLAGDDDLARAVVVRRPHVVDPGAELLDHAVVEADDRGHRARMPVGRLGHRPAALLDERDRVPIGERCGRSQRGVLAYRVADDEVRLDAESVDGAQARKRGRNERRLLHVGARQLLDRALEADLGDVVADRLGGFVVDGSRLGKPPRSRGPCHVLGALAREAEGDPHAVPLPQTV